MPPSRQRLTKTVRPSRRANPQPPGTKKARSDRPDRDGVAGIRMPALPRLATMHRRTPAAPLKQATLQPITRPRLPGRMPRPGVDVVPVAGVGVIAIGTITMRRPQPNRIQRWLRMKPKTPLQHPPAQIKNLRPRSQRLNRRTLRRLMDNCVLMKWILPIRSSKPWRICIFP